MDRTRLADYLLHGGVSSVSGWLSSGAASATVLLSAWQEEQGIGGNIAEIGIHHGRYFILLANLRTIGEEAIAIDIFENQQLNIDQSGRGNYGVFTKHLQRYTDNKQVRVLTRDSATLRTADVMRPRGPGVRLFSIDGAHTAAYTLSDLILAEKCLVGGGIVILDDFYNPDWPGVQEGFFEFMRRKPGIVPLAYGNNKMFLCRPAYAEALRKYFDDALLPYLISRKHTEISGHKVVHANFRAPSEIFNDEMMPGENLFVLKSGTQSPRYRLMTGWATPQHNGVWTLGSEASVELDVANLEGGQSDQEMSLVISALPLLHEGRRRRGLRVLVDNQEIGDIEIETATMRSYEFDIPRGLIRNPFRLSFIIDSPEAPALVLGSTDQRPLGFFFDSVRLSRRRAAAAIA